MGSIGEHFADGVERCKCGSTDLVVETTSYLFIKRNKDLTIVDEFEGDETDNKITCMDCEKEFEGEEWI